MRQRNLNRWRRRSTTPSYLVRKVSPHAKLIVVGPISPAADPGPDVTRVRDIVRDEAVKIDAIFVDPIADQWFVGDPTLIREDGSADG